MSISKEIFGIENKKYQAFGGKDSDNIYDRQVQGFNEALDLIDQYELSEEELAKILNDYMDKNRDSNDGEGMAKAIKSNQSKLFVRKNKWTS